MEYWEERKVIRSAAIIGVAALSPDSSGEALAQRTKDQLQFLRKIAAARPGGVPPDEFLDGAVDTLETLLKLNPVGESERASIQRVCDYIIKVFSK